MKIILLYNNWSLLIISIFIVNLFYKSEGFSIGNNVVKSFIFSDNCDEILYVFWQTSDSNSTISYSKNIYPYYIVDMTLTKTLEIDNLTELLYIGIDSKDRKIRVNTYKDNILKTIIFSEDLGILKVLTSRTRVIENIIPNSFLAKVNINGEWMECYKTKNLISKCNSYTLENEVLSINSNSEDWIIETIKGHYNITINGDIIGTEYINNKTYISTLENYIFINKDLIVEYEQINKRITLSSNSIGNIYEKNNICDLYLERSDYRLLCTGLICTYSSVIDKSLKLYENEVAIFTESTLINGTFSMTNTSSISIGQNIEITQNATITGNIIITSILKNNISIEIMSCNPCEGNFDKILVENQEPEFDENCLKLEYTQLSIFVLYDCMIDSKGNIVKYKTNNYTIFIIITCSIGFVILLVVCILLFFFKKKIFVFRENSKKSIQVNVFESKQKIRGKSDIYK